MQNEKFDIVDDNNNIIGETTRGQAHKEGLTHKSAMWFTFNQKGELFVNKRSLKKEFHQGFYSLAMGGHVTKGDSYDDTVKREALEEAGITAKPRFLEYFQKRFDDNDKENSAIYFFVIDHEPKLDKNEVEFGEFIPITNEYRDIDFSYL